MPPSVHPNAPMSGSGPSFTISSWASDPRRGRQGEAIADFDTLDGLDSHQRRPAAHRCDDPSEHVIPRPGGSPLTTTSTTPPRVSPSLCAWSISATSPPMSFVEAQRTGSASTVSQYPRGPGIGTILRHTDGSDGNNVAEDRNTQPGANTSLPRRTRLWPQFPSRWRARALGGNRRSRTSAFRRGRRDRAWAW